MTLELTTPAPDLADTLAGRARRVFPPAAARHTGLAFVSASGATVTTDDGRTLLDFASGVACTNVGHGHPEVVARMHEQIDRMVHVGHNIGVYPGYVELAEKLVDLLPDERMVFFANSGAESLEGALKLAMRSTGRSGIVAFKNSFHGRTMTTTALTASNSSYRRGLLGALPAVHHVGFPAAFANGSTDELETARCLRELDELFDLILPPDEVAAIVIEPVQGEGGYQPAPPEFLRELRARCDAHGIVLIFDEIQSGFGRTGRMFAYEHSGVIPDVLVVAKGIANGMPLSAMIGQSELMSRWPAGAHGGTFGGNPVACAAALAVIGILQGGAIDNAARIGAELQTGLDSIVNDLGLNAEVRGLGMMIGVELRHQDGRPSPELVESARSVALDEGLLVLSCGVRKNVLRLMAPTTLTHEEAAEALRILRVALVTATA